ncbi:MAG: hypothetical protein Q8Q62_10930, partial [Mesorhizobium sp.]|nr:hypothetical protein [Mesorhizobium sp.]
MPFIEERAQPDWIATADPRLAELPLRPLGSAAAHPSPARRKWTIAVLASIAVHVAVAAFVLTRQDGDLAQIAGAENSGILMQGNAPEDQIRQGDMVELDPATQVTIVPLSSAKPVETVEATAVEPVETIEAGDATVAEAAVTETLEQVTEQTLAEARPDTVVPVVQEAAAQPVEAHPAPTTASEILPEILAVDTPEIVDENTVQPLSPTPPTETIAVLASIA